MSERRREGPGVTKVRRASLLHTRELRLSRLEDGEIARAFARADVVSEGETRNEPEGPVYYGSTSLLLAWSLFEPITETLREAIARALSIDPHARLRALRVACREAQLRAGGRAHVVRAEIAVRATGRGVAFEIDVLAALAARGRRPA